MPVKGKPDSDLKFFWVHAAWSSAEHPCFGLNVSSSGEVRKLAAYDETLQRVYICVDNNDYGIDLPAGVTFVEAVHLLRRFFWWWPEETIPETFPERLK